jgi:hypothetical protein
MGVICAEILHVFVEALAIQKVPAAMLLGNITRMSPELTGSEAAKIGSTASCSAAALAPQWRHQPPGVPIGARAGPGAPVGVAPPLG